MANENVATYREGGGEFLEASDATDNATRERGGWSNGEPVPGIDGSSEGAPASDAAGKLSEEPASTVPGAATNPDDPENRVAENRVAESTVAESILLPQNGSHGTASNADIEAEIQAAESQAHRSTGKKQKKQKRRPEASLPPSSNGSASASASASASEVQNGPLLSTGTFLEVLQPEAESLTWSNWKALETHIDTWYHNLDFEAFRIALATVVSHKFLQEEPIWLFLIGPAGTGKTVTIHAMSGIKDTHVLGDLTPQTFLSGFNKGKKYSLLHQVGNSATFLFKDLTTFLSKRPEERGMIGSHLREIYDGSFSKSTGASLPLKWEGKITIVAATTPAIERAWTVLRDMGERFITVRWPRGDGIAQAFKAHKQIGHEKGIIDDLKRLTMAFLDIEQMSPAIVPSIESGEFQAIVYMAEMVARLRAHVGRDVDGKRQINDCPSPEGATRLMKVMTQLVKAHATMFRRKVATIEDLKVARRVAIDSIPFLRWRLISVLPDTGDELGLDDVREMSGLPKCAIDWNMDELEALGIVEQGSDAGAWYKLRDDFLRLKRMALC